ncbi:DinB family protein [Methanobrevibacter sp.]|uniref:DinB family protein n=1 Tax=Methanobrevibacter sp. TaxID=66852 RepID=UPI00388F76E9
MDQELQQVVADWRYLRENTLAFINSLSEEELKKKLPRPGLDSFMKHFEEMCDVEQAYLDACLSGSMEFDCVQENEDYKGESSKEQIIAKMQEQDERIDKIIQEKADGKITWSEDDIKSLNSQLRNLCVHETLHIGQLIAFSYVMGIAIPEFVVEGWALS